MDFIFYTSDYFVDLMLHRSQSSLSRKICSLLHCNTQFCGLVRSLYFPTGFTLLAASHATSALWWLSASARNKSTSNYVRGYQMPTVASICFYNVRCFSVCRCVSTLVSTDSVSFSRFEDQLRSLRKSLMRGDKRS
jgi:hypothetical protein